MNGSGEGGCLFIAVVFGDDFSDSEVTYLDTAFVNENIFGFDISVNDAVLFKEFESNDCLSDKSFEDSLVQLLFLVQDKVLECALIAVL